jgi:hypothetical protein
LDTRQRKKEVYHSIIIVPHRDSLKPLEEYRAKLFAAGFPGAFSFPMAAPLASVSRPFRVDELKVLGRNIRELTNKTDGKILCSGSAITKFTTENTEEERRPPTSNLRFAARGHGDKEEGNLRNYTDEEEWKGLSFFGVPLNLLVEEVVFPQTAKAKILDIFSPPALCTALLAPDEKPPSEEGPAISFRAASLANLAISPLESGAAGYSFEWKIGPLVWLPKYKGG